MCPWSFLFVLYIYTHIYTYIHLYQVLHLSINLKIVRRKWHATWKMKYQKNEKRGNNSITKLLFNICLPSRVVSKREWKQTKYHQLHSVFGWNPYVFVCVIKMYINIICISIWIYKSIIHYAIIWFYI